MAGPYVDYPFHFDEKGRSAVTTADDHVLDMIHQVLFTNPGERVNRPDFGCGLARLVFAPGHSALATATQFLVHGALQRWLAEVVQVESVDVLSGEGQLTVEVVYTRLDTGERRRDRFASPRVEA